jgi:hypothetical protein
MLRVALLPKPLVGYIPEKLSDPLGISARRENELKTE